MLAIPTKLKSFINEYKGEGIIFHQKKMIGKSLRKVIRQLLLMFCMLKKKRYILLVFKK